MYGTGYNVREGSAMIADRIADTPAALEVCECGETLYQGRCYNVGDCRAAERRAVRASLVTGAAASARPAAWTVSGGVD